MSFDKEITDHYLKGHEKYLCNISVDCIIFGFHDNELKILLLHTKYAYLWALPGRFIKKAEHMHAAAKRILKERTGLNEIYKQQFYGFFIPEGFTKKINQQFLKKIGVKANESWMFERFINVGYAALVNFSKVQPVADVFSNACEWFNIHDNPEMLLNHRDILIKVLKNLLSPFKYHPMGYNLLPEKFTMPELQKL